MPRRRVHNCAVCANSFTNSYQGNRPICGDCRIAGNSGGGTAAAAATPMPAAPPDPVVGTPVTVNAVSNAPVVNPAPPATGTAVPSYFSGTDPTPKLVLDYRRTGHNWRQAETMLNASILRGCMHGGGCCNVVKSKLQQVINHSNIPRSVEEEILSSLKSYPSFEMLSMRRIENVHLFERFRHRELQARCRSAAPRYEEARTHPPPLGRSRLICWRARRRRRFSSLMRMSGSSGSARRMTCQRRRTLTTFSTAPAARSCRCARAHA